MSTQLVAGRILPVSCSCHFLTLSDAVCQFPPATGGMPTGMTCYLGQLRSPVPVCDGRINTSSICVGRRPQSLGGRQLGHKSVV